MTIWNIDVDRVRGPRRAAAVGRSSGSCGHSSRRRIARTAARRRRSAQGRAAATCGSTRGGCTGGTQASPTAWRVPWRVGCRSNGVGPVADPTVAAAGASRRAFAGVATSRTVQRARAETDMQPTRAAATPDGAGASAATSHRRRRPTIRTSVKRSERRTSRWRAERSRRVAPAFIGSDSRGPYAGSSGARWAGRTRRRGSRDERKDEDDKKKVVQKRSADLDPSALPPASSRVIDAMSAGGGAPLAVIARSKFESRFGTTSGAFACTRTLEAAAATTRWVRVRSPAATTSSSAPASTSRRARRDRWLIAHELRTWCSRAPPPIGCVGGRSFLGDRRQDSFTRRAAATSSSCRRT